MSFIQAALIAGQLWLGEVTRPRPKRISFEEFAGSNEPSEIRSPTYIGGTVEVIPQRIWYGDFSQRAVERDSHWTDYLWAGALAFLLDTITVAYRYYVGECFILCWGPDAHVELIKVNERPVFAATPGTDNAGSSGLIDDPQAWGGDQPPGEGGEYAHFDITRGNYTDHTNSYLESLLTVGPPNKTPSLQGISLLVKYGRSGFTESGYFAAGGVGFNPRFREWKVTLRRQPDNLATGFHQLGRHMNAVETIYEWSTSYEYGAGCPVEELNLDSFRDCAETLYNEYQDGASAGAWSGKIESQTHPQEVVQNVLQQIDGILDPSPSLGLTMRLIRRDYSFNSLRVLDQDSVTTVERFTPGTYEDTKNKVIIPYHDIENNSAERPALYIDPANQQIQSGRVVSESKEYVGIADAATANLVATRDGRALSIPRAPLTCSVTPSFGRLTYRGEVLIFQWGSPSFTKVMRVLSITPGNSHSQDYRLIMIEDQFAIGFRTFGEPEESEWEDPGEGLGDAPPDASWDTSVAPCGLVQTTILTNTNQFQSVIEGHVLFGSYTPGGQYGRIWVTEPGGVQTLSPIYLSPNDDGEATFTWPAIAVGNYEFCIQTYSILGATSGNKVCCDIDIANIGSPSYSPSASASPSTSPSTSPSVSPSLSPSSSISPSTSSSVSPSFSVSPSQSQSPSASVSPSGSVSPSASVSPSSSASPSPAEGCDPSAVDASATGWFDGHAASFNGVMADNDPVGDTTSRWLNRLDTAKYMSQATAGNRPLFKTGGPNGENYVAFDSSDAVAYTNNASFLLTASAYTMMFVVRPQANSNDNTLYTNGGAIAVRFENFWSSGANKFSHQVFSAGFQQAVASTTYTLNAWGIVEVWRDGTNIYIKWNNDTQVSAAQGTGTSLLDSPTFGTGIQFDLAYAAFFNTDIGQTKRDQLRECLAIEYGLSIPSPSASTSPSHSASPST